MAQLLTVITARAGSKRIPGKNTRDFLGRPLIHWTLYSVLKSKLAGDIVVSTDDPVILSYAKDFPEIEFLNRPASLAEDQSSSVDALVHVMKSRKKSYSHIMLLQPTSPLRTQEMIESAISSCLDSDHDQMVSVRPLHDQESYCVREKLDGSIEHLAPSKIWVLNGAIYISKWDYYLENRSFLTTKTFPFFMDDDVSVDIDTENDWQAAEKNAIQKWSLT